MATPTAVASVKTRRGQGPLAVQRGQGVPVECGVEVSAQVFDLR
jgi:hypothetical protein